MCLDRACASPGKCARRRFRVGPPIRPAGMAQLGYRGPVRYRTSRRAWTSRTTRLASGRDRLADRVHPSVCCQRHADANLRAETLRTDQREHASDSRGPFTHRLQSEVTKPLHRRVEAATIVSDEEHQTLRVLKPDVNAIGTTVFDHVLQRFAADRY